MASLQDIINLAEADGGKFFVIDESGDAKLVIMPVEEYQRLLLGKLQKQILDVENINKEIIKAQLTEDLEIPPSVPKPVKGPVVMQEPRKEFPYGQSSDEILRGESEISKNDLRAEVIDPSFDFEGPKVEIDDL